MTAKCWCCRGNLINEDGYVYCLACGRPPIGTVETVSMGEALLGSAIPLDVVGDAKYDRDRQVVPIEVSLERAAKWARGERA